MGVRLRHNVGVTVVVGVSEGVLVVVKVIEGSGSVSDSGICCVSVEVRVWKRKWVGEMICE